MADELIPMRTTVVFAHAVVQVIADEVGADILHIKGPAAEPEALGLVSRNSASGTGPTSGLGERRSSVDADVLVRPHHVGRLLAAMRAHGWMVLYDFRGGSPFEHASTLGRSGVANVDVHRYFPGIELDAEKAFDRLWDDRRTTTLAGCAVQVPSLAAQRLILILHAARNARGVLSPDIRGAWTNASADSRTEVTALAEDLRARVALAAGTGTLALVRAERSHDLWEALSTGEGSQVRLWRARVRAASNRREGLRTGVRLLMPNITRMASTVGHPLSAGEVLTAYVAQAKRGLRALATETARDARTLMARVSDE